MLLTLQDGVLFGRVFGGRGRRAGGRGRGRDYDVTARFGLGDAATRSGHSRFVYFARQIFIQLVFVVVIRGGLACFVALLLWLWLRLLLLLCG